MRLPPCCLPFTPLRCKIAVPKDVTKSDAANFDRELNSRLCQLRLSASELLRVAWLPCVCPNERGGGAHAEPHPLQLCQPVAVRWVEPWRYVHPLALFPVAWHVRL
eukprot:359379-Chlamydomonas_euryale.AAC.6